MPKYYTPKEANETLTVIRPMLEELMQIGEKIRAHQPELWIMAQKSAGNGGSPELSKLLKDFDRLDELIHKIQKMDIHIKDLTSGLIDFPAWHEDREIYLCWQVGEDDIAYWHEIESGYSGRQRIDWE
jgi:hypothetical protein